MSQSFHLYQLQKIDSQLDQIQQRILVIQNEIANDTRLASAREESNRIHAQVEQVQRSLKKIEHEVESRRLKLEQSEANLYSGRIKVPKELQDLQSEVASLKRGISGLEDQQLEIMIQLESVRSAYEDAQQQKAQTEALVTQQHAGLIGEQSRLENDKERLLIERNAVVSQVLENNLTQYNNLRQRKQGIAVAAVEDYACTACGAGLTPAQCQAARSPAAIVYCPSCGRIIYAG